MKGGGWKTRVVKEAAGGARNSTLAWGSDGEEQLGNKTNCATQGPRTYTKPPSQESAPEGPNLLVGSRGSD